MTIPVNARDESLGWHHWLALLVVLLAALGARLWQLDRRGAWDDELFSMELSTGRRLIHQDLPRDQIVTHAPDLTGFAAAPPWTAVFPAMADDTHPPLHPLLLRFWREVFGESDVAGRSFSVVVSIIGVLLLFDVVRHGNDVWAALAAAGLMALASPQIAYAQETRDYALLIALVLGCCAIVVRMERFGATGWRCAILGVLLLLTMLCVPLLTAGEAARGPAAVAVSRRSMRARENKLPQCLRRFPAATAAGSHSPAVRLPHFIWRSGARCCGGSGRISRRT